MLTSRDGNKSFKLDGDLLRTMTCYTFNVTHSNPQDQKLIYEFGKEKNFFIRQKGRSPREKLLMRLLQSSAVLACGLSTENLSSESNEL